MSLRDVDKFVKMPPHETPERSGQKAVDIFSQPHAASIATYSGDSNDPEVFEVASRTPEGFLEQLVNRVFQLVVDEGGNMPLLAIKEIVCNLVHADFAGVTISIMDNGAIVRVSDHGPGIPEKKKSLERGYSAAGEGQRSFIKGVGSGLYVAERLLRAVGGSLEIDDNLRGGSVITLHSPKPVSVEARPEPPPATRLNQLSLTKRQKKVFFIIIELGAVGPSRIASELSVGLSTIYRELGALEDAGLVEADSRGKRTLTADGLSCVDSISGSQLNE